MNPITRNVNQPPHGSVPRSEQVLDSESPASQFERLLGSRSKNEQRKLVSRTLANGQISTRDPSESLKSDSRSNIGFQRDDESRRVESRNSRPGPAAQGTERVDEESAERDRVVGVARGNQAGSDVSAENSDESSTDSGDEVTSRGLGQSSSEEVVEKNGTLSNHLEGGLNEPCCSSTDTQPRSAANQPNLSTDSESLQNALEGPLGANLAPKGKPGGQAIDTEGGKDASREGPGAGGSDKDTSVGLKIHGLIEEAGSADPRGETSKAMVPIEKQNSTLTSDEGARETSASELDVTRGGDLESNLDSSTDRVNPKATESRHHIRLNHFQQQKLLHRVTRAFELAQQRGGEIRLRLSPPALGSLRLELKFEGQKMSARLEAEHMQARQILLEQLPALRDRLAEQGITIETFEVDLQQDAGNTDPRNAEDSHDEGASENYRQTGTRSEGPDLESGGVEVSQVLADRALNVMI